ncbi:glutamine-hydrolyzing carbamoyl-phosphate synthase small subunit [Thiohalorhabdus methylotrophus]|uniref:Carbamoyl phosphate synthase small chain n=1 Tax=Thiohalorhabdus methylotrophus TaxID=3242694 RepID=A0ABV4TWF7_9GAMM
MSGPAILALEDGTIFDGYSIGVPGRQVGEVCFNTSMTGYQEILTDPSYARQIVTLTYTHIGSTGANPEDDESREVFASGLVIRDLPMQTSSWRAAEGLTDYLCRNDVVAIAGIDTRKLVTHLRDQGAMRGVVAAGEDLDAEALVAEARGFHGLTGLDLAGEVSTPHSYSLTQGTWSLDQGGLPAPKQPDDLPFHVVALDYGCKQNILRLLVDRGCRVTVMPGTVTAEEVLAADPDGIFLSNGPGDPEPVTYAVEALRQLLASGVPIFGICLGHQLLCLAEGARSEKLKFGHRGGNHPVKNHESGRVEITAQNHGFAIDGDSLPEALEVTHTSLFDGTLEGVRHRSRPAFSVQYHPEASPGPHDSQYLFDQFLALIREYRGEEPAGPVRREA